MRRAFAAIACVLACAGCVSKSRAGPESCKTTREAVAAAPLALIDADNSRDLEGVLTGYTPDAVWLPPDGAAIRGRENFRPRYESLFRDNRLDLTAEIAESHADGTTGYAWGSIRGTRIPLDGTPPASIDDIFMAVMRCEAGHWRVSHLMWAHKPAV